MFMLSEEAIIQFFRCKYTFRYLASLDVSLRPMKRCLWCFFNLTSNVVFDAIFRSCVTNCGQFKIKESSTVPFVIMACK